MSAARSISAHAEEPVYGVAGANVWGVYLRARGGTAQCAVSRSGSHGLSPRTRRNREMRAAEADETRSISAHAEEPEISCCRLQKRRVYLRARGGTHCIRDENPRASGLSPRTRRNLFLSAKACSGIRSISAHAEEPRTRNSDIVSRKVYLRARGGTLEFFEASGVPPGLSPRTRRNRCGYVRQTIRRGSISAHAEEPRGMPRLSRPAEVYLRARGGTRALTAWPTCREGLSPRTRRNLWFFTKKL
ncbi:Hypothetical protein GbCGDNIH5_1629 [Granulibacter bethesdensis]|nr:Hypothetical protein GbCGDNIH5_1629 [Granulibacter bethesdensis]